MQKLPFILTVFVLLLASCAAPQTPMPTDIPAPTSTDVPTEIPTSTPTPEPTATATMEPSPTPDPIIFRDDFDGNLLDGWQWIRENPKYWNLTEQPGWLEIINRTGYIGRNNQENILLREAPAGNFEISTKLKFKPGANFQFAGLVIYEDKQDFLAFGRAFCNVGDCAEDGLYMDLSVNSKLDGENFSSSAPETDTLYLKLIKQQNTYKSSYSVDGEHWMMIGEKTAKMQPGFVGLVSGQGTSAKIPSYFDYFIIKALP